MRPRRTHTVATTVLVSALCVASILPGMRPSGAATPPAQHPAVGVNFHGLWSDYTEAQRLTVLDRLAAANAAWVRIDMGWASFREACETCTSQWYVDLADRVVNAARARGLRVLVVLWATPSWANGGAGTATPPADLAAYGSFAGWAAAHFRGRVEAWEIWNEPNQAAFWTGTAGQYVEMLRTAYTKVKEADPAARVVLGGPAYNDTAWLEAVYGAGAQGWFDVLATHPYQSPSDLPPEEPDTTGTNIWLLSHVEAVRELMIARGDGTKPIWFTEFGWSSHSNGADTAPWERGVTEAQQADYVVRAIRHVAASYDYVEAMFWYGERDEAHGTPQLDNYGLLYRDLRLKPSYRSLRASLSAVVRGKVRDGSTGTALIAASVTWTGPRSGSVSTGSRGTYAARWLPPGTYTFTASATGCSTASSTRALSPGVTQKLTFSLAC